MRLGLPRWFFFLLLPLSLSEMGEFLVMRSSSFFLHFVQFKYSSFKFYSTDLFLFLNCKTKQAKCRRSGSSNRLELQKDTGHCLCLVVIFLYSLGLVWISILSGLNNVSVCMFLMTTQIPSPHPHQPESTRFGFLFPCNAFPIAGVLHTLEYICVRVPVGTAGRETRWASHHLTAAVPFNGASGGDERLYFERGNTL